MDELRCASPSANRRILFTLMTGALSLMMIAGEPCQATAGWFSRSKKPADENSRDSTNGFTGTIRKLMKEAKEQEAQGNLDKAIELADRATKVSEATASIVKSSPDVSPAYTSRYARELRLKKAEQSFQTSRDKRSAEDGSSPETKSDAKTKVTSATPRKTDSRKAPKTESKANATAATRPLPAKSDVARKADPKVERPIPPQNRGTVATTNPPRKPIVQPMLSNEEFIAQTSATKSDAPEIARSERAKRTSDEPISRQSEPVETNLAKSKTPSRPDPISDDIWDSDDEVAPSADMDQPASTSIADNEESLDDFADPTEPEETELDEPVAAEEPIPEVESPQYADLRKISTQPLKLRPQYATNILDEIAAALESTESQPASDEPAEEQAFVEQAEDEESEETQTILPVAAAEELSDVGRASISGEKSPSKDEIQMRLYETSPDGDPIGDLQELRRRLQSAAAFEPGAVAPGIASTISPSWDPASDEPIPQTRVLRLRKRRGASKLAPKAETTVVLAKSRKTVAAQVSVIQWRPAKVEPTVSTNTTSKPASTIRMPEDLRQAFRGMSSTPGAGSASPSPAFMDSGDRSNNSVNSNTANRNRSNPKSNVQLSAWDNAPSRDHEMSHSKTSPGDFSGMSMSAPMPPQDSNVEWTSFDEPSRTSEGSSQSSIAALSGSEDASHFLHALEQSASDDEPSKTKKSAQATLSTSTFWTMLGGLGFAVLMVGLWMVRAAVRSNLVRE